MAPCSLALLLSYVLSIYGMTCTRMFMYDNSHLIQSATSISDYSPNSHRSRHHHKANHIMQATENATPNLSWSLDEIEKHWRAKLKKVKARSNLIRSNSSSKKDADAEQYKQLILNRGTNEFVSIAKNYNTALEAIRTDG
eukprot:164303_1